MGRGYTYDEDSSTYPFFMFVMGLLLAVPCTFMAVRPTGDPIARATRVDSDYKTSDEKLIAALKAAEKRKKRRTFVTVVAMLAWAVVALAGYLVWASPEYTSVTAYNPYDILGISESATEREIKSKYRKMSLKFHPDKVRPDPAKNETIESLSARYVDLTKAYQSLTDEVIRENWLQFGHPDGRSDDITMGVALPEWMVSDNSGIWLVLGYTVVLGILLPLGVGRWWYGTQKMSKEGILMESANTLFREYTDDIDEGGVIKAISCGAEFKDIISKKKADADLAAIESRIVKLLSPKNLEKLEEMDDVVRRKTLALLWAYLNRVDLGDAALNKSKFAVAPIARDLVRALTNISLAYGFTDPILAAFRTSQRLVQAIPPKASELLQLPFFTEKTVAAIDGNARNHVSFEQYMSLPEAQRRELAVTKGDLSEVQFQSAMKVAKQLPKFQVDRAFFKVTGERAVTPSSLVNLVVKGRVIPYGVENVPAVEAYQLEDPDPAEDDLDALNGKKKKTIKTADGKVITMPEQEILPSVAFAPYYARNITPSWYIFLTDSKQGKLSVPPFKFPVFDEPVVDANGKPTFNVQTMKAMFAAPPSPGDYTFVLHLVCDAYMGLDSKMEVTLHVADANQAVNMGAEDDISEPEEDSLAGTMQMLKTGNLPKVADDSEDESGTDDDEEDDTSDTNTDTEDEDE